MERVFGMTFASVYPLYLMKVERKGRTQDELEEVIGWLTCCNQTALKTFLDSEVTLREFFDSVQLHPAADQITGVICGIKVQEIQDPLMRKIRYLDKVVDELAKGKAVEKIKRG